MSSKGQHVVPNGKKWAVRRAGAERASGVFSTQKEAIDRGKELAKERLINAFGFVEMAV